MRREESVTTAFRWVASHPDPEVRGRRVTAMQYAADGLKAFPGCKSVFDICERYRMGERTFYRMTDELRDRFSLGRTGSTDLQSARGEAPQQAVANQVRPLTNCDLYNRHNAAQAKGLQILPLVTPEDEKRHWDGFFERDTDEDVSTAA